ncbi:unnamed protein product [Bemisia tabaci]|uniref:Cuticular protein n=1 Tax=Bemisia tabaci TaxID=7038 RepID=A0A9P0F0D1_BEMTA|nr:unnamed protein product [Bemisia tabaci]
MDTSSFLQIAAWLIAVSDLTLGQLYSSIPLRVVEVPSPYPWGSRLSRGPGPLGRKLITFPEYSSDYPTDILVQSNSIYFPPNSNTLRRNYFLPNPIPGKSPIIFRPTSLQHHPLVPIPIRYSRVSGSETPKDRTRTGFVLDNSLPGHEEPQSGESLRVWESKPISVKPFPLEVYDPSRVSPTPAESQQRSTSVPLTEPEDAKTEKTSVPSEKPQLPVESSPLPVTDRNMEREPHQFYKKEKNGRVIFGFHTREQTRMESRDADAKVYGAYTYFDPSGNPVRMQYWDEGKGFHMAGNTLPQNAMPEVVTDTPEVQAAKQLHHKLYEQTLAHLIDLQNLRPPKDMDVYGEAPGSTGTKPAAPTAVEEEEEEDDEVIIDSQKLPDDYTPPTSPNNLTADSKSNDPSEDTTLKSADTPDDDNDSVVIENPSLRKRSRRAIDNTRAPRHHPFFGHGFTRNAPFQLPLFPAYSVFSPPTHFRPSPPEVQHPPPGKFAPLKTKHHNTFNEPVVKLVSPFSEVAHRFEELLHSKTPSSYPAEHEEFDRIYQEPPTSTGFAEEPHPWLTAPSAPEVQDYPPPIKQDFKPAFNLNAFPQTKFTSDFHVKGEEITKGPLFSTFPSFLYPQSSQTIIRTDVPHDFKYHGYFPKAPVSYQITHFDNSDRFHFANPFSRPFIGHDYTLIDKNYPSSNPQVYLPYVQPVVGFPPSGQLSDVTVNLPSLDSATTPSLSADNLEQGKLVTSSPVEQTTAAQSGLKIIVTEAPAIEDKKEESTATANGKDSETSTENYKIESSTLSESTESNESTESTEPSVNEASSSNEDDKNDSSLVIDGRLSAEESTSVVESITEVSTEAETAAPTGRDRETSSFTGSEKETSNLTGEDRDTSSSSLSKAETPEINGKTEQKVVVESSTSGTGSAGSATGSESPETEGELTNTVRRNAAETESLERSMMRVVEIHDAQVSPRQRVHSQVGGAQLVSN